VGDTVFIGSCSGTFYALDKASGEKRWAYDIRADGKQTSFHGDPLVDAGTILVGTDYSCDPDGMGNLYAFNIADGTVRWKYNSPVGLSTNVIRVGSNAWVGTVVGDWASVGSRSGRIHGLIPSPQPEGPCNLPKWLATAGDSIIAVGKDNLIYALSNRSARVRWKVKLPADPSTSPAVQGNEILVGASDQRVYRLAARDGTIKSSFPVNGVPVGRPLVVGDVAFFILDSDDGKHGAVTALGRNGILWSTTLQQAQSSEQPYEWNGTVLIGDCGGTITAIRANTGAPAWSVGLKGCIRSIGGDNSSLYVGAQEGTVFAIQP
jgi:outer membrane protein assembly factor BamB